MLVEGGAMLPEILRLGNNHQGKIQDLLVCEEIFAPSMLSLGDQ